MQKKGTEVFVGGLPRTISENKIRQEFSACGEIVEIRMIKDPKGNLKGFCFVRFSSKEAADRAMKEKSGTLIDGKKIGVLPSVEQNTLYFGNLNKAWTEDEFEKLVLHVFPDVVSIELPMLKDVQPSDKKRNRGFAFVKFSSHTAAMRAQRLGSQPDFRLGNLHPVVQWAEEDPEIDPKKFAMIKIAFIRNLPGNADENFLKHIFEPFGKVEKVVVSTKGSSTVGFVHFTERPDLDKAVKEMSEKTIQGPGGGPTLKLQVEVARPMDKNKKRLREDSESIMAEGHSKILKEELHVAPSSKPNPHFQSQELSLVGQYEDAILTLPLAVKERLLRILRLGIATRFDIDIKTLRSLKDLPESTAVTVLDQFMLSGAAVLQKGAYLSGLISKHLSDIRGLGPNLLRLSKVNDTVAKQSSLFSTSYQLSPEATGTFSLRAHSAVARPDIFGSHDLLSLYDYPLSSRATLGASEEKDIDFLLPSQTLLAGSQNLHIPRMGAPEERWRPPLNDSTVASLQYGSAALWMNQSDRSPLHAAPSSAASYARIGSSLNSEILPGIDRQASRQQMRFDPFSGEPYKFDPFTGEPILPR